MSTTMQDTTTFMLGSEIELLMTERARLLRVAGAAAQFVAVMDSRSLPEKVATEAEILAESVNALREETLKDALAAITRPATSPSA
jgi:hypothetical protein